MPDLSRPPANIPPLFVNRFRVDDAAPFKRHLNRLEVEIAREDYSGLKSLELVEPLPDESFYVRLKDLTELLLHTTQNNYNRQLIKELEIRIYMDVPSYRVYYRLGDRCICFRPHWREQVLESFFDRVPQTDTDWQACRFLSGFNCRFIADGAGGTLLLAREDSAPQLPLLTVSHGPYDPHTLEVALYFLRNGKGRGALINLGFSGREPLADKNLQKLKAWGCR